ncbi:MAG TPA: RagB/SusD family nutrient uptake outer membrane protein, partial [Mangrovimonas sp.]|nr:RagB/SusD family nutrient uptake outer membrane protein [Mangrovimonas sp.]
MKKIIYLLGIMAMVTLTSCDLDTPAQSTLEESIIFSTPGLAIDAVDGIKEPFGQTNSYRGRFIPWYGMNTDVEWNNNGQNYATSDQYDLVNYDPKSVNSQMNTDNNAWAQMYASIERANIVIRGIRTYGNPIPGSEMGELLGEALTLRAIVYADLTKAWGDVPARFEPITGETVFLPKSSRDVIYKQLLADLDEAADLVPWPNESILSSSVERVNKAFVKGLRARIALIAGGYQQYPDGIRLSTDPDLSRNAMYTIALNECLDVINSGTAHLESTFETLWRKVCLEDTSAGGEA